MPDENNTFTFSFAEEVPEETQIQFICFLKKKGFVFNEENFDEDFKLKIQKVMSEQDKVNNET